MLSKCRHVRSSLFTKIVKAMDVFQTRPGFCPECGSILPLIPTLGNVTCYHCKKQFPPEVYGDMKVEYTLHFNKYTPKARGHSKANQEAAADGPVVERKCPKCGHEKMSYATLQLRSADEGQTVFFTCLKCRYKESENS